MEKYIYQYSQTFATTGYFNCEPEKARSIEQALLYLAQNPLDTFMRRYCLRIMRTISNDELAKLSQECLQTRDAVLASLLLENNSTGGGSELARDLERLAEPYYEHTPFPLLANRANLERNRLWSQALRGNIHAHSELEKEVLASLPAIYDEEKLKIAKEESCQSKNSLVKEYKKSCQSLGGEEPLSAAQICAKAQDALAQADILAGPEMRHEATLSPIALLRQWRIDYTVHHGRHAHHVEGIATAYGKGLSLAAARASCLMEIVERACAYAGVLNTASGSIIASRRFPLPLCKASGRELLKAGKEICYPSLNGVADIADIPLHWIPGRTRAGDDVLVPCQAVFLFCNLDEPALFESVGSTGLASGSTMEQARLAALVEILERDAHATMPFIKKDCFILASREKRIQDLLDDYRHKHIYLQFQDIGSFTGLPVYRCFVTSREGEIFQASGAALSGAQAALSALMETPWPYSWASPFGKSTAPLMPDLPVRYLEDLPDYNLGSISDNLAMLEEVLCNLGREPVYVDISRSDLPFQVVRAFVPGLETSADFDETCPPSARLLANCELYINGM